ncbi:hypothetical protein EXM22_11815 [Oceanispirochaeta crateris]|uniref:Capsule assembly Wzi family protein n=1 Tax=Oceanispirochaeta crateris TaxID=2518645 RepID=A0A5C1QMT1_9SPIO|nr:hypothetical protein [Oceanispirochaeta crateris]QEN08638.1 hypothetical protein EXM22_11815 [Oceanispirochaeta crateris]
MKKIFGLLVALLIGFTASLPAQTHNAVLLDETALYDFLDQAELKGYVGTLRAVQPYPRSLVVSLLKDISKYRNQMTPMEREVFQDFYEDFVEDEDEDFVDDGDIRIQGYVSTLKVDVGAEANMNAQLNELKDSGGDMIGKISAQGDVADNLSWGLHLTGGFFLTDDYDVDTSYGPTAWEPYTYTKEWDGGIHYLSSLNNYNAMPSSLSFGYTYNTEIAASFLDNSLDLRFGRLRRNWGVGDGTLFLTDSARPFMGVEGVINPWDWVSVSFLTGELEYGESFRNIDEYNIKDTSRTQQNMFSILQVELMPTDWLYLSLLDSGVYMKRTELGYVHPLMSQFFYQNNTGDFDNMAFGGTVAVKKAGLGKAYFSLFLDEARFNQPDFFSSYSNMYSYQAGIEAPVPGLSWSKVLLQYTKVEPFTYTHYTVSESPWYYGLDMETDYLNGGESLGSGLEPNSDELKLKFNTQPMRGVTAHFGYRLIRHGTGAGSYFSSWGSGYLQNEDGEYVLEDGGTTTDEPDESNSDDYVALTPDNDPDGAYGQTGSKSFLKDAIYEWYHILSMGASWDLSSMGTPISFGVDYTYVFKFYTDYQSTGNFQAVNTGDLLNESRHLLSLYMKIFP